MSKTAVQVSPQSQETFQDLVQSGYINDEQRFTWTKLNKYGPVTGMELHEKLVIQEDNHKSKILGPERVRKRITELKQKGLVMQIEKRECGVTGRTAAVYAAVPIPEAKRR